MYQQSYNYYPNNSYQQQQKPLVPLQPTLKGRPVSSIEEVRATAVDFDGSIFYFPDLANNKIYTKQINMDGTSTTLMYELKELPTEHQSLSQYVTRDEFESVISQLKGSLQSPLPQSPEPPKEEFKF